MQPISLVQVQHICEKNQHNAGAETQQTGPWQVGFINCARIIGSESKPKCTVPRTACIGYTDVNTFTDAHRPAAETNALNTINSFGTASIVRETNVNAMRRVEQHRPTTQRRYAKLICAVVTYSQTQCIASSISHIYNIMKVYKQTLIFSKSK